MTPRRRPWPSSPAREACRKRAPRMTRRAGSNGRRTSGPTCSPKESARAGKPPRLSLSSPGGSEAAGAAGAGLELFHDLELDLRDGHHDQLRNAVERLDGERRGAAVPNGDHERSLVIRVDEADQVAEHD